MPLDPALFAPWRITRDDAAELELHFQPGAIGRFRSRLWRFGFPAAAWTGGVVTLIVVAQGNLHEGFVFGALLYFALGCVPLWQHRLRAPVRLRVQGGTIEVERRGAWWGRRTERTPRAELSAVRARKYDLRSGRGSVGSLGVVEARVQDAWRVIWHNRSMGPRSHDGASMLARECAARLGVPEEPTPDRRP